MLAHHDGGLDWGERFPAIVAAVNALAIRSCIVDGGDDRRARHPGLNALETYLVR
jgi:hypothetical protein